MVTNLLNVTAVPATIAVATVLPLPIVTEVEPTAVIVRFAIGVSAA